MAQLKNVRAGMLLITDAGLELKPGEVAEATSLTPEMQRAVATGHLVLVRDDSPAIAPAPPEDTAAEGIAALQASDAVTRIQAEADVERLREWQSTEKRRSVVSAINARLQELASNTG